MIFPLHLRFIDVPINRWQVLLVDNLTVRMSVMDSCDGNRTQPKNTSTGFHLMLTFSSSEAWGGLIGICNNMWHFTLWLTIGQMLQFHLLNVFWIPWNVLACICSIQFWAHSNVASSPWSVCGRSSAVVSDLVFSGCVFCGCVVFFKCYSFFRATECNFDAKSWMWTRYA